LVANVPKLEFKAMRILLLSMFLFGSYVLPAYAQNVLKIGQAETVIRAVFGNYEQTERTLSVADSVYSEEVIKTTSGAATDLVFEDETTIKIGPDAEVLLDRFIFDPNRGAGDVSVSLLKGTLRFVSGKQDSSSYKISTPSAVVTVRGTVFALVVDETGTSTVVVEDGKVTFSTSNGRSVDVGPGESSSAGVGSAPSAPAAPTQSVSVAIAKMNALSAVSGSVASPVALSKASTLGSFAKPAAQTTVSKGSSCGG
jgi:hypothetical protein